MERLLVSVAEAMTLLSVRKTTIFRLCAEGCLERVKIGRRTCITLASIDRLAAPEVRFGKKGGC